MACLPPRFDEKDKLKEPDPIELPHAVNRHLDLANLAYHLWERRGGADGSPEQDWYEAERLINQESESTASVKPKH